MPRKALTSQQMPIEEVLGPQDEPENSAFCGCFGCSSILFCFVHVVLIFWYLVYFFTFVLMFFQNPNIFSKWYCFVFRSFRLAQFCGSEWPGSSHWMKPWSGCSGCREKSWKMWSMWYNISRSNHVSKKHDLWRWLWAIRASSSSDPTLVVPCGRNLRRLKVQVSAWPLVEGSLAVLDNWIDAFANVMRCCDKVTLVEEYHLTKLGFEM